MAKKKLSAIEKLEREEALKEAALLKDELTIKVKDGSKEIELVYDADYVDGDHAEWAMSVGEYLERIESAEIFSVDQLANSDYRTAIRRAASYLLCRKSEKGEVEKPTLADSEAIYELLGSINMKELPKLRRIAADFFTDTGMSQLASRLLSGRKEDNLSKIMKIYMATAK
jgi:hypothetical protein